MPRPRKDLISITDTPYYHVISRCVRRAFLCGTDTLSGQCFEHRREWIRERVQTLQSVFAIDIASYAVMSNHFHLVVRVSPDCLEAVDDRVICEHWGTLFRMPPLVERWLKRETQTQAEIEKVLETISVWRARLSDLSWFMRCLNEHIARRANAEDRCTGRFFEGRFKSQALLDEKALLTCMAYVDLNPIRAGMAKTPETSEFTSIQQRIKGEKSVQLMGFDPTARDENTIPFDFADYLELVDWSGRAVLPGKRGSIEKSLPPILARLNIDPDSWVLSLKTYGTCFQRVVGPVDKIRSLCQSLQQKWLCGLGANQRLFGSEFP